MQLGSKQPSGYYKGNIFKESSTGACCKDSEQWVFQCANRWGSVVVRHDWTCTALSASGPSIGVLTHSVCRSHLLVVTAVRTFALCCWLAGVAPYCYSILSQAHCQQHFLGNRGGGLVDFSGDTEQTNSICHTCQKKAVTRCCDTSLCVLLRLLQARPSGVFQL